MQAVEPSAKLYVPCGQRLHGIYPVLELWCGAQKQLVLPDVVLVDPGGHMSQFVYPWSVW